MFRALPNLPSIDPVKHLGHRPLFPDSHEVKLSPCTYISRHYKIRNIDQGRDKIARVRPTPRLPDANTHYLRFNGDADEFIVPADKLFHYAGDHAWHFECKFNGNRAKCGIEKLERGYAD